MNDVSCVNEILSGNITTGEASSTSTSALPQPPVQSESIAKAPEAAHGRGTMKAKMFYGTLPSWFTGINSTVCISIDHGFVIVADKGKVELKVIGKAHDSTSPCTPISPEEAATAASLTLDVDERSVEL